MGIKLLAAALDLFAQEQPNALVYGQVKSSNHASRRMFEELGFNLVSASGAEVTIYQLDKH
jgi:L-amino acid N-acyltransferase YncA